MEGIVIITARSDVTTMKSWSLGFALPRAGTLEGRGQFSDLPYFNWSLEKVQKLANLRNATMTSADPSVRNGEKRRPDYLWEVQRVPGTKKVVQIVAVPFTDA